MKTEWEFRFEARDFHFDREYKYEGVTSEMVAVGRGDRIDNLSFSVRIVPAEECTEPGIQQTGSLFLTVPFPPEEAKSIAYSLARAVADRIAFQSGDFRLRFNFVTCKRIGETEAERIEIDDKEYIMHFTLVEVAEPPRYESGAVTGLNLDIHRAALLPLFNATVRDNDAVRKFLGFFRILESLTHSASSRKPAKQVLRSNSQLRDIFEKLTDNGNFDEFVTEVVDVRNRCAHLKIGTGFGFAPSDPAMDLEVRPMLSLLEAITRRMLLKG